MSVPTFELVLAASRDALTLPSSPVSFGKRFQNFIIQIHRWMGVVACVLMVTWFVSGLVLAYVHFPAMTAEEKLTTLKPIQWEKVRVSPAEALQAAGMTEFPSNLRLEMSGETPVYRVVAWDKSHQTVSATTGKSLSGVTGEEALAIVRRQLDADRATLDATLLDSDQWTVTGYFNHERPFHRIALNDPKGMQYYVSVATGEIVLDTSRSERILNWVGAIPHWLYFEFLRNYRHEGIWTWTIYILSVTGIFVSLSGLWIGISRLKLRTRYGNGSWTPFGGWMKWHHILGIVGGLFLALWITTGFMTMYPGGLLEQRGIRKDELDRYAGNVTAAFAFEGLSVLHGSATKALRATFRFVDGHALVALEDGVNTARLVDAVTGRPAPLSLSDLQHAAQRLLPGAGIVSAERLEHGDEYWHSGFYPKKTPIVRVKFDDADGTWFHLDPGNGEVLGILDRVGRADRWSVVAIHDLDWHWLLQRRPLWDIVLFAVTIPGLLIAATAVVIGFRRLQRTAQPTASSRKGATTPNGVALSPADQAAPQDGTLVVYASQTGRAELLARKTAAALEHASFKVTVRDIADLSPMDLGRYERAFFVAATAGEGDAPDKATGFERRVMRSSLSLPRLQFAVLALGDRQYSAFCGFGLALDEWLRGCGAQALFPAVEVDNLDEMALAQWASQVGALTNSTEVFAVSAEPYQQWTLVERRHVNPGSAGWEVWHLEFEPAMPGAQWDAGDIAQIVAGASWRDFEKDAGGLTEREYSIASTSTAGRIHLLVRRMWSAQGTPGIGSTFLADLALGESIALRVRRNPAFHGPKEDRPMILIGNGTGIAGLRAHLLRRAALGHRRSWLIFGERNRATDSFYAEDLERLRSSGHLERIDLAFSRDQPERRYVQHILGEVAEDVRAWVHAGASLYICGSLRGMAPEVADRLTEILGADELEELIRTGRYCRDVY